MVETIAKNDFVEVDFIGTIQETGDVFDTTKESVAKEKGIAQKNHVYRPLTICVGQGNVVPGLDAFLQAKEIGKTVTVTLEPEQAFGKKNATLLKLVPTRSFLQANIRPMSGLDVTIDGSYGVIKTVNGGRTIVDFNHPLAGKKVMYEVTLLKKVTSVEQKLESFLSFQLRMNKDAFHIKIEGDKALVHTHFALPKEFQDILSRKANELIPELKEISYQEEKEHK